jgi:hypothetical protein
MASFGEYKKTWKQSVNWDGQLINTIEVWMPKVTDLKYLVKSSGLLQTQGYKVWSA